jgi:hypothetical protein
LLEGAAGGGGRPGGLGSERRDSDAFSAVAGEKCGCARRSLLSLSCPRHPHDAHNDPTPPTVPSPIQPLTDTPPTPHPTPHSQLNAIKAKREAVNGQLDALRSKETEARSDVPGLIAERKEASEIITALRKKQGEIRDAFNAKWTEFKKQERAWRVWAAHERKAKQEERKKEYEERSAARKLVEKANKPSKFEEKVGVVAGG